MSDLDINAMKDEGQVEITDLDAEIDGSSTTVAIQLLRLARTVPLFNHARDRFTLLIYLLCIVVLLFMIQPGLPVIPKQTWGTSFHELQYPLAIYPFTMRDTTSEQSVTSMRNSNGQLIVVETIPGSSMWHHCRVLHGYTSHIYKHLTFVVCT